MLCEFIKSGHSDFVEQTIGLLKLNYSSEKQKKKNRVYTHTIYQNKLMLLKFISNFQTKIISPSDCADLGTLKVYCFKCINKNIVNLSSQDTRTFLNRS